MLPKYFRKQPQGSRGCICSFAIGGIRQAEQGHPFLMRPKTEGSQASSAFFKKYVKEQEGKKPVKKKLSLKKMNKENICDNLFQTFQPGTYRKDEQKQSEYFEEGGKRVSESTSLGFYHTFQTRNTFSSQISDDQLSSTQPSLMVYQQKTLEDQRPHATSLASLKGRCMGVKNRAQSPKVSISQIRKKITGERQNKKTPKVRAFSTDRQNIQKQRFFQDENNSWFLNIHFANGGQQKEVNRIGKGSSFADLQFKPAESIRTDEGDKISQVQYMSITESITGLENSWGTTLEEMLKQQKRRKNAMHKSGIEQYNQ